MPRKRIINHGRRVYVIPHDFPQRLKLFKEESGLSWAELARRLGTSDLNLRRWRAGVRPHPDHLMALLDLAEGMGLLHIFTAWKAPQVARRESVNAGVPRRRRRTRRTATARRGR